MDLSVVICTYNRCQSLRRTLEAFRMVRLAPGLTWELLVVDNNSDDQTAAVCGEFGELPLRYVYEPQQGKSHALNRSVQEAQGELILFTDDDVDVSPDWLQQYADAAQRHPEAAFFGGRVVPRWEVPPPAWLAENESWLLVVVRMDAGDKERLVLPGDHPFFIGANMACRQQVFELDLRFALNVGPSGADEAPSGNVRGEEIELQRRLLAASRKGLYVPSARVYHRHLPHRLTEGYLRRWYFGHGVSEVRTKQIPLEHLWLGAPRYYWKRLLVAGLKYLMLRYTGSSAAWLKAETEFAFARGVISESSKQNANLKN